MCVCVISNNEEALYSLQISTHCIVSYFICILYVERYIRLYTGKEASEDIEVKSDRVNRGR